MKIGIFGGTFNPTHKGHLLIANYAQEQLQLDKLIFLPALQSPYKTNDKLVSAKDRCHMLHLSLQEFINDNPKSHLAQTASVSDFEVKRRNLSYAIDSVKYFRHHYPNAEIYWLIGSDHLKKLHKWKDIKQISELVRLTMFKRQKKVSHPHLKKYRILLLQNPLFDFSSTLYKNGDINMVVPSVQKYIAKQRLYLQDFMANWMTPLRFQHSVATASLCATYAKKHHYNVKDAYLCGLLHDLTKNWALEDHHKFLKKMRINVNEYSHHQLHSLTASLWLSKIYQLDNPEITDAIGKHTTLAWELTTLDKILFASDKLCDGRKWNDIQKIRNLMLVDFDNGFKKLVAITYQRLKKEHKYLSNSQIKIYEKWAS